MKRYSHIEMLNIGSCLYHVECAVDLGLWFFFSCQVDFSC